MIAISAEQYRSTPTGFLLSIVINLIVGFVINTPCYSLDSSAATPGTATQYPDSNLSAVSNRLTLSGAIRAAETNYPAILRAEIQARAAAENVHVQKLSEYVPEGLFQMQELMASHNRVTQTLYGSPVFPSTPGLGLGYVTMRPLFFSGAGVNVDWAPLDFGLHKARIELAKSRSGLAIAQSNVTRLDAEINAASSFLDVVEAEAQVQAVRANVAAFEQFVTIVRAQVRAQLKPGADESLAIAQLMNARNQLQRALLNYENARADLANSLGLVGSAIEADSTGLITRDENSQIFAERPVFEHVPILQASRAAILTAVSQRRVLDKEYYPVFHWLAGFQLRGSGMNNSGNLNWQDAAGFAPVTPNYQVGLIINWNFLDCFRIKAEKKVQDLRIADQQLQYNLVLNNLRTEDVKARNRVKTAIEIVSNMPPQVQAAEAAVRQAESRYKVGLSSVAQVAEANQVLAQSRLQYAMAKANVWRALLAAAAVHGDLHPLLVEADRVQRGL